MSDADPSAITDWATSDQQPPRLSILCATVVNRADLFAKLHAHLQAQAQGKPVEIVVACDNKEISIGLKRQQLLERATGDYVSSIDDDDWVAPDYVDRLLAALESSPDCVGFKIECVMNGGVPQSAITSMRYRRWGDNQDGFRFTRSIYHKSVTRRDLALKCGFPDMRYGEDKIFSEKIMHLVKREVFVDAVLYFYRFKSEPFNTKYGFTGGLEQKGINRGHRRRPFQH
jgi:glycosyltransferase involved in cell wall biosynthesis